MVDNIFSILLVDDDLLTRGIFADRFRAEHFEVYEAADGQEGFTLAQQKAPSIIFTGIMMPKMTGFEMVKQLKANLQLQAIPVIVFSHLGREEDKKLAYELGAKDFLVKGITTPNEILHRVQDILLKRRFVVSFNPLDFDAPSLMKEMKSISPTPKFELTPMPEEKPGTYRARFIPE
ncbi:MAG: hypothetical protein A2722_00985 [Candidatus Doudnabacteria bacterium RIFCSPHIGHO2_01_FULL_50_11]|uniref:Response regulatory domain-containing protein n=1 Tax=Candidatus Doudnabacteria bacterium RIFCSPHIGHO2_01_FULL_50_11 TaxID=1817828 RepID=A0A1F5PFL0_9BACT|nr:MAG: hypothetical protein A2722_00985 [Candidatus Doudnabacteria bacterium RIFCSPHIGHO2_01_FULL_50_11]HLC45022.1 response regulator [Patescibacteria group bacterium]